MTKHAPQTSEAHEQLAHASFDARGVGAEGDMPMTLVEHIRELRKRLILALCGIVPGVAFAAFLSERLLGFLVAPIGNVLAELGYPNVLHIASPTELFFAYTHISLVCGLIFASPWIAYQAWLFIAPGLYAHEKAYAVPFAIGSGAFFGGGAFFGYHFVFPFGFKAMIQIAGELPYGTGLTPMIMLAQYLGLATQMLLAFGTVFEVPVVVSFLALAGLVSARQLLRFGRYWVAASALLAAVLTPSADVVTQLMMMAPLVVLYYTAVAVAYALERRTDGAAGDGS